MWAGIGLGIALAFLDQGNRVVLSSRTIDNLRRKNSEVADYCSKGQAFLVRAELGEGSRAVLGDYQQLQHSRAVVPDPSR